MRSLVAVLFVACHSPPEPPPPAAPERVVSSKARAADLYIKGYNSVVDATAHHLIGAHNTALTLAEMGHIMPRFGVQHELMKEPLRQAHEAFNEARTTDAALASSSGVAADAVITTSEALTESFHHLSDYYDRAGFQTDNGAQKERLERDFNDKEEAYRTARAKLEQAITVCDDELAVEELQRFEAAHSYGYWLRRADIDAKLLERASQKGDAAAFATARKVFDTTIAQMEAFANAHPKGTRTFGKLITALGAMNAVAARLEVVIGKKKDVADAEALNLERAYSAVAKVTARLYEMETSGGLE